jgi:hypothetical protein
MYALKVVMVLLVAVVPLAVGKVSSCSADEATTGLCEVTATLTDDEAILGATDDLDAPDSPRKRAPRELNPFVDSSEGSGDASGDPLADCADPRSTTCVRPFIATVTAPITLADIAAFRPTAAVDTVEPNGWTVAGLDTNFYATGTAHVVDGTLLGRSASVRFTPVEWHWSYGDGTAASHPVGGGSWAAQGIREFDPTPTSHVYEEFGTYYIDLDVEFAAEYRFSGGPWVGISGALVVPANQLVVAVGDAKTVLVERECTRDPGGPGC